MFMYVDASVSLFIQIEDNKTGTSLEEAKLAPVGAPGVPDDPVGLAMLLSPPSHLRNTGSH